MSLHRIIARVAKTFENQEAYDAYMKAHPDADPKNHSVAHPDTAPKTDTERMDHSKPVDMTNVEPPKPEVQDLVSDDTTVVKDVVEALAEGTAPNLGDLFDSLDLVNTAINDPDWEKSKKETERLLALNRYLKEVIGLEDEKEEIRSVSKGVSNTREDAEEEEPDVPEMAKKHKDLLQDFAKKAQEETQEYQAKKKEYDTNKKSAIQAVTDAGLDKKVFSDIVSMAKSARKKYEAALKKWNEGGQKGAKPTMGNLRTEWSKTNPKTKVPKKVMDQVLGLTAPPVAPKHKEKFIATLPDADKPDFEAMSDDQFEAAMQSLISKGKKGSLRSQVIRLAYLQTAMRPMLLKALG